MKFSTVPNFLSISRVPIAILAYISFTLWNKKIGLILFLIGFLTDCIDGKLARKYNCQTELGKLLDPITDKFLVLIAFFILGQANIVPYWLILLIALREIYFTILRINYIKKGFSVIAAGKWGKLKTLVQMLTLGIGLFSITFKLEHLYLLSLILSYVSLILTYYSALEIFKKHFKAS